MNRVEFMTQLESLLQNISQTEREEALQYYNDYFDDAGFENEQDVVEALGNPAKVAETIKRDMAAENGYGRAVANDRAMIQYSSEGEQKGASCQEKKEGMPTWAIVLIVVLCVFAAPVILGLGSGLLGTLFGILAAWFGLIIGFGVATFALIMAMIFLFIVGVMCIPVSRVAGIALFGIALILGGLSILFLMLTVAMAAIATPAIIKGIVGLVRKITKKKSQA